jgi:hypothetical protein
MDNFIEKQFIPFLASYINYSDAKLALDALKTAKKMVNYYPIDDLVPPLMNALHHKNKDVAHFALDVIRMKPEIEKADPITPGESNEVLLDIVLPFLDICFEFPSDEVVLNALNISNDLSRENEIDVPLFNLLEKMMRHKTDQVAHLALDIIRGMGERRDIHIFEGV